MVGGLTAAGAGPAGPGDSVSVSIITLGTAAPGEVGLSTLIWGFSLHTEGSLQAWLDGVALTWEFSRTVPSSLFCLFPK